MSSIQWTIFIMICVGIILGRCRESSWVRSTILVADVSSSHSNLSEKNVTRGLMSDPQNVTFDDNDELMFEEKRREDAYNRTTPEEDPHSVLLVMRMTDGVEGVCSGSLLTPVWVLTAAHCLVNADRVIIYAGGDSLHEVKTESLRPGSQLQVSTEYHIHPGYKSNTYTYDVAVIKTMEPFNMTATVNTIPLAATPWTHNGYRECRVTGYGMVNTEQSHAEDQTRKTHRLDVKRPCLCSFKLSMSLGRAVSQTYLCSKPVEDYGVCQGDSGSGLVCDGQVRGVAMQLIQLLDKRTCDIRLVFNPVRCGGGNTLSVFQNTCYFVRWINSHVGLYNESVISTQCQEPRGGAHRHLSTLTVVITVISLCIS